MTDMTDPTDPTDRRTWRDEPPFRADHVGSLLRPPRCSRPEPGTPPARLDADALREVEDAVDRRGRRACRRTPACRRRPTASSAVRRGTWTSSTSSAASTRTDEKLKVHFRNAEGDLDFESAALRVHDRVTLADTIFGDAFALPARDRRQTAEADRQADHPVAEHGALPRRPGRDRRGRLPRPRARSGPTSPRRTPSRCAGSAELGCTYLQLDDTSLAYLNDPAAARDASPRRARDAEHQHEQYIRTINAAHRRPPRRRCASPRTCAAATTAPRGRPRAATTSSPRRCSPSSTSTASSSSTTTSAPAASSRCGSCPQGKQVVLGLVTTKSGAARGQGHRSSGGSTRRRSTSRSTSSASHRSAASPRRSRATRSPSTRRSPSSG